MSLVQLIIILVCLGILAYVVNRFLPADARIKSIIVWVIIIVAVLIVLSAFGILDVLRGIAVPRASLAGAVPA